MSLSTYVFVTYNNAKYASVFIHGNPCKSCLIFAGMAKSLSGDPLR